MFGFDSLLMVSDVAPTLEGIFHLVSRPSRLNLLPDSCEYVSQLWTSALSPSTVLFTLPFFQTRHNSYFFLFF